MDIKGSSFVCDYKVYNLFERNLSPYTYEREVRYHLRGIKNGKTSFYAFLGKIRGHYFGANQLGASGIVEGVLQQDEILYFNGDEDNFANSQRLEATFYYD